MFEREREITVFEGKSGLWPMINNSPVFIAKSAIPCHRYIKTPHN